MTGDIWALQGAEHVGIVDCGEASMVFNPLSWETHRVSAFTAAVIGTLAQGPQSERELLASLSESVEIEGDMGHAVHVALEQLASIGLARRSS
jgi:PqqD family protein of HPr-rel-A system